MNITHQLYDSQTRPKFLVFTFCQNRRMQQTQHQIRTSRWQNILFSTSSHAAPSVSMKSFHFSNVFCNKARKGLPEAKLKMTQNAAFSKTHLNFASGKVRHRKLIIAKHLNKIAYYSQKQDANVQRNESDES